MEPFLEGILKIFNDSQDAGVQVLQQMMQCSFIKEAIFHYVVMEDETPLINKLIPSLLKMIKLFLQRFPSDSVSKSNSPRMLHSALRKAIGG